MAHIRIINADVMVGLAQLEDESVNCVVTSPPYWGLRDYGVAGQIGLEDAPDTFVARLVDVFREVRRVLRSDGTLWLNLGDSYCGYKGDNYGKTDGNLTAHTPTADRGAVTVGTPQTSGMKNKDLVGIPWLVAFALRADGWYLRQDIIWHKPNPMPESVTDRCTKAHEYIFLLAKSARYHYDDEAIKELSVGRERFGNSRAKGPCEQRQDNDRRDMRLTDKRNARSVWSFATKPYNKAHFATFPEDLAERCIKAGCPEEGLVLDPFGGAGTTGLVAAKLGRDAVLLELNPEYAKLAEERISGELPLLATCERV